MSPTGPLPEKYKNREIRREKGKDGPRPVMVRDTLCPAVHISIRAGSPATLLSKYAVADWYKMIGPNWLKLKINNF